MGLFLKRVYRKPPGWAPIKNMRDLNGELLDATKPEGECLNPPPLDYVKVLRAGPRQNFSHGFLERGIAEGWAVVTEDRIRLATRPPLAYRVRRVTPNTFECVKEE